jgi:predicted regulator of Ras-like GTPase activity (Roadblock/LC7/MglB family)
MRKSDRIELDLGPLFTEIGGLENLDGALFLRRTGEILGAWVREGVRRDVMSVMSATAIGAIEVLMEDLQRGRPDHILIEADANRLAINRTADDDFVVLIAPPSIPKRRLVSSSRSLASRLSASKRETPSSRPEFATSRETSSRRDEK